jgi:tetratricopeptide (TPR) repeat protein
MASVFLSYDHEDSSRAAPLAAALEANGHSVWWDRHLHGGAEYNSAIETAVETADAVVVLWSGNSVRSAWVRDEAGEGRDRGRLVPVLIESVKPPMGFRQYQTIDLATWNGGKRIPRLPELLHAIEKVAGPAGVVEPEPPKPLPKPKRAATSGGLSLSRRAALGAGAATAVALAGGGIWWSTRPGEDPRLAGLVQKARDEAADLSADENTIKELERAVAAQPKNAKALGLLALANSLLVLNSPPDQTERLVNAAQASAQRALAIDDKEPNALLAMFELQGSTLDWFTRDQKLRQILAIDPNNLGVLAEIVLLTQATGMWRESWDFNEQALALAPLNLDYLSKRALKLWILGHVPQADKVIDQARALNPKHPWLWWVRFYLYAVTGRPQAAQAMLNGDPTMLGYPPLVKIWKHALLALAGHSPSAVAATREACVDGARKSAILASQSVTILALLGDLDTAFEIANGLLLARGPIVRQDQVGSDATRDASWRISTQWMFTPAAKPMFNDPRFLELCQGIGLTDYWRRRNVKPDYQLS